MPHHAHGKAMPLTAGATVHVRRSSAHLLSLQPAAVEDFTEDALLHLILLNDGIKLQMYGLRANHRAKPSVLHMSDGPRSSAKADHRPYVLDEQQLLQGLQHIHPQECLEFYVDVLALNSVELIIHRHAGPFLHSEPHNPIRLGQTAPIPTGLKSTCPSSSIAALNCWADSHGSPSCGAMLRNRRSQVDRCS